MSALAQDRELLGDTKGNCGSREGARDGANLSSYTVTWSFRCSGCWSGWSPTAKFIGGENDRQYGFVKRLARGA